jgi:undecaprenyl-diphosphatase
MNIFDMSIIHFLNGISQKSSLFESFMDFIVDNDFIKGAAIVSILWFFWFRKDTKINYNRERILITLFSCIVSIFVGRLLARILPYRVRPLLNPDLTLFYPNKSVIHGLELSSSFPSDHAVLFFSLATGIFLISKKTGIFSYLYVFFIICFPRIYLGLHYPTDILMGAGIGILITLLLSDNRIWHPASQKVLKFSNEYSGLFYVLFFLISFQISTLFQSLRSIVHFLLGSFYETML